MKSLVALAVLAFATIAAAAADPMQAFPPAEPGLTRFAIKVPPLPVEADAKVELIIGKRAMVDPKNRFFFGGKLEKEPIKGWGYDRYILRALGPMAGTMMAVDPSVAKVERFIPLAGEPRILRYNSRLPIVVYVPDGVEVRYRIWRAEPNAMPAEKS